jgi:hypothetical protein
MSRSSSTCITLGLTGAKVRSAPEAGGSLPSYADSWQVTEGLYRSLVKTPTGTGAWSDASFVSSSANLLDRLVTWLSLRPSNLSPRRQTTQQYATILGS